MKLPKFAGRILGAVLGMSVMASIAAQAADGQTYQFRVYVEGKPIGTQSFVVSSEGERTQIRIEALFEVKYWVYTAYRYRHTNTETWKDGCLHAIQAQTDDNGTSLFVRGDREGEGLTLVTHEGTRVEQGCIKTFAYWDPDFLDSRTLLNSQTGEMNRVTVKALGEEEISVGNQTVAAARYRLAAEKFSIDLWYSAGGEWLALQSTTEKGSTLRYERE
jgi:hypothetical protein